MKATTSDWSNWLTNCFKFNYAGTIRSRFPLTPVKMEKYCNLIKKSNPVIDKIFWVIEKDEDPYSTDRIGENEAANETRLVKTGNHAHLIVETKGGRILKDPNLRLYGKLPFYIPYWMPIKSLKQYMKYGLSKISKSGNSYGIVL